MKRAMWSGVISFGLVTIPVKLYTATESHSIGFHLLHKKCDTRIKEQRFCPHCEKTVDWDDLVKGFEYAKGKYVELTDEDFEQLPLLSKDTIDVSDFVPRDDIDPIYFDSTYYVQVSEKGARKAGKLLAQVLADKQMVGIASIAFRNKEHLCVLRPADGKLVLQTLLYADEIREDDSERSSSTISAQEKKMAENLVEALSGRFEPNKYKDRYQIALKKLIDAKLKGGEVKQPQASEQTEIVDLMEALRASVERAKGTKKSATPTRSGSKSASAKAKTTTKTKRSKTKRGAA